MKSLIAVFVLVFAYIFAATPAAAVVDNGTGIFWLYDGANGTGAWRDYNVGPFGAQYNISTATFTNGTAMNNKISSVKFSCGSSGSPIDQSDYVQFYDQSNATGLLQTVNPNYPAACANGVITINLSSSANNRTSSFVTNE